MNWKLPGGLVDEDEKLENGAIREVKEETGIDTDFLGILGMREITKFRFNRGDLYLVCLLKAKHDFI